LSDFGLSFADTLKLPTFKIGGQRFIKRVTLVSKLGKIVKVFYPVFPPDSDANEVIAWLRKSGV
jgi:peroxiredoxin